MLNNNDRICIHNQIINRLQDEESLRKYFARLEYYYSRFTFPVLNDHRIFLDNLFCESEIEHVELMNAIYEKLKEKPITVEKMQEYKVSAYSGGLTRKQADRNIQNLKISFYSNRNKKKAMEAEEKLQKALQEIDEIEKMLVILKQS